MTFIVTVVEKALLITITLGQIMQPLKVAGDMVLKGTKYNIDLCEGCFTEVLNFIKEKRRKVLGPFNYPYNKDPLDGTEYL